MKTKIILRVFLIAGSTLLASCYTVKGVGQDVQKAGSGISKGADKVQQKITE